MCIWLDQQSRHRLLLGSCNTAVVCCELHNQTSALVSCNKNFSTANFEYDHIRCAGLLGSADSSRGCTSQGQYSEVLGTYQFLADCSFVCDLTLQADNLHVCTRPC